MEAILHEIKRSMDSGNWYAAVALTLTLPDICSTLIEPENARKDGNKARYLAWCRKNLSGINGLDAELFWELRCGVVHNGAIKHRKFQRVALSIPDQTTMHNMIIMIDGVWTLILDAETLCVEICSRIQEWWLANRDTELVQKRKARVVSKGAISDKQFGRMAVFISDLR